MAGVRRGREGRHDGRHVLSHQAGLPRFPPAAASLAFDDHDALVGLLESAVPDHPPGEAVAEHALTYGHLCDALVRAATGDDLAMGGAGGCAAWVSSEHGYAAAYVTRGLGDHARGHAVADLLDRP